jgi:hypothetical protein
MWSGTLCGALFHNLVGEKEVVKIMNIKEEI